MIQAQENMISSLEQAIDNVLNIVESANEYADQNFYYSRYEMLVQIRDEFRLQAQMSGE